MDSLWSLIAGLAGAAVVTALMPKPKAPQQTALAPPPTPEQPPQEPQSQAAKAPSYETALKKNRQSESSGPMAGPSSTFLTGPSGIDPARLRLGRTSLLGS